jgi:uncharacterized protein (TIGR02996 family)
MKNWTVALEHNPSDYDLRLVYSDWLEENGQSHQATIQRHIVSGKFLPARCDGKFFPKHHKNRKRCWVWFERIQGKGCGLWGDALLSNQDVERACLDLKVFRKMLAFSYYSDGNIYRNEIEFDYTPVARGFPTEILAWKALEFGLYNGLEIL